MTSPVPSSEAVGSTSPVAGMEEPPRPARPPARPPAASAPASAPAPHRPPGFSQPRFKKTGMKSVTKPERIVGILPWQVLDFPPKSHTPTIDEVRDHIEGMDSKLGYRWTPQPDRPLRPQSCLPLQGGMGDETTDPKPIMTEDQVREFRMRHNFPISKVTPRSTSPSAYQLQDSCSYHVREFKGLRDDTAKEFAMRGLGSVDTLFNRYGYVERRDRRKPKAQAAADAAAVKAVETV